jgi:hypothetical protein
MSKEGRCINLPATYKTISKAKMRKNLMLSFDLARIISSRNENRNDSTTEMIMFRKKETTDRKETASPATIKLKRSIQIKS